MSCLEFTNLDPFIFNNYSPLFKHILYLRIFQIYIFIVRISILIC